MEKPDSTKIFIEIYKNNNADTFTKNLASPDSKIDTGSASAYSAAAAAAVFSRALYAYPLDERMEYIVRNSEIIRSYMVNLIDEDVKCRGPLRRAIKENDPLAIEAAKQTSCCINAEIINMMIHLLEFIKEVSIGYSQKNHYLLEAVCFCESALKSSKYTILNISETCSDETFRFVTKRENELITEQANNLINAIIESETGKA